jgi:outer membrane protein, heavy metal efflux system
MLERIPQLSRSSTRVRWHATIILGFALAVAAVLGAEPLPSSLSLADARRIAFEHNWDLLAARSEVDAAIAQRIVAREFPNPSLSVQSTQINVNGAGNATPRGNGIWRRSYDTVVAVNQLFEIGGKRTSRRASAEAEVKGAEARLRDARRVLDHGVTKAYIDVLFATAKAEIISQSAASLRREAGVAQKRFRAGDIMRSDLNQIEIAADRMELDAHSAEQECLAAKMAVEVLLGSAQPTGVWLATTSLLNLAGESAPNLSTTRETRPDLAAAQAGVAKAEAELRLQRAQRLPDPTILVQYEHQPPSAAETVGIGLSLPLPLWNRNGGAIRAAMVARQQAEQQQLKVEAQIAAEIILAQHTYVGAVEKLRRQRGSIEPSSTNVRQSVAMAYEKGGVSLLELLAAERGDNEVRIATAQAAAETATALSALYSALNLPPTDSARSP